MVKRAVKHFIHVKPDYTIKLTTKLYCFFKIRLQINDIKPTVKKQGLVSAMEINGFRITRHIIEYLLTRSAHKEELESNWALPERSILMGVIFFQSCQNENLKHKIRLDERR